MKTQLFTLIFIFSLALNSFAVDKIADSKTPDHVTVNELNWMDNLLVEESLSIEPWMTNDLLWNVEKEQSNMDNLIEDELTIESWMTDSALWEAQRESKSNVAFIKIGNHSYKAYRIKNTKEAPLQIEAWMTNDRLWAL